jgi:hypothetical protein
MPTAGKLEVTIKINELPVDVTTDKNGWKRFRLDCGGRMVDIALRPRMWTKLEEAKANYPMWVAAITGLMGPSQGQGFALQEPALQVFERKPRQDPPPPPDAPPAPEG